MDRKNVQYGKKFDYFLAVPFALYILLIVFLVSGIFVRITPEALKEAFSEPALLNAIKLSLATTIASTLLSVLVAVPSGYLLSRRNLPGHFLWDTILDLPIVLPPLVMGLSVLIFFNTSLGRWLDRGIVESGLFVYQPLGIVLVQFAVGCAFAVRVIKAGFDGLDHRYEEVAMVLGANRAQTFFKVVLPNIAPSLVAGAVISWARIFGLFGPVLLVCGTIRNRTEIMPTTIFLETSIGRIEVALVVGALMILISMTTIVVFKRLGGKGYLW
ncbi:ABC transporter permease [Verrucomicrobiota bacterium]